MKKNKIKSIKAREILDSRGNPTVEVDLETEHGIFRDSVPSGVSVGKYEAVELRDGGKRYHGKGTLKAIQNIKKIIAPNLKAEDVTQQKKIDGLMRKLDGTENKSKLGANAILPVSMAVCRAGAAAKNIPLWKYIAELSQLNPKVNRFRAVLPSPCSLLIEGGVHAGNELDFQEFMIVPQIKPFSMALQAVSEIYHQLKEIIPEKYTDSAINIGDEGGFAVPVRAPEEALNLILEASKNLGYEKKIKIILDCAASEFFSAPNYKMKIGVFNRKELIDYYSELVQKYPIIGLEDPFYEEDSEGFIGITKKLDKKITIIGDDFLATNLKRIKTAQKEKSCNGLITKLNQVGTVTETIASVNEAKKNNWKIFVKHRAGETNDDFIADMAVGLRADAVMVGAPARGERLAKYNRLLRIEEELKS